MTPFYGLLLLHLVSNALAFPASHRFGLQSRNVIFPNLLERNTVPEPDISKHFVEKEAGQFWSQAAKNDLAISTKAVNDDDDDDDGFDEDDSAFDDGKDDSNEDEEDDDDSEEFKRRSEEHDTSQEQEDDETEESNEVENGSDSAETEEELDSEEDSDPESKERRFFWGRSSSMTPQQKCDLLVQSFLNLVQTVNSNLNKEEKDQIRMQMMQTTGIDMYDTDNIRQEACEMARITNLAEFAGRSGISLDTMKQYYPTFVATVNQVREVLRKNMKSPYLKPQAKKLMGATLHYYDTLANIGLLQLS